ncbi:MULTISPECIES: hypothetical protein [Bradyrhizobium]|nr:MULTISPECIES: hypothetical protein [Bradyrhizobium]
MNTSPQLVHRSANELKSLLDHTAPTVYSMARPITVCEVNCTHVAVSFKFEEPVLDATSGDLEASQFAANPMPTARAVAPCAARAARADGIMVGDPSAGRGKDKVKVNSVEASCTQQTSRKMASNVSPEGNWRGWPDHL